MLWNERQDSRLASWEEVAEKRHWASTGKQTAYHAAQWHGRVKTTWRKEKERGEERRKVFGWEEKLWKGNRCIEGGEVGLQFGIPAHFFDVFWLPPNESLFQSFFNGTLVLGNRYLRARLLLKIFSALFRVSPMATTQLPQPFLKADCCKLEPERRMGLKWCRDT